MGPTLLTRHTVPVPADPIQRLLADPPDLPVRGGLADIAAALRVERHRRRAGAARHRQDHAGPAGRRRPGRRPGRRHPAAPDRRPGRGPAAGTAAGRAGRRDRRLLRARRPQGRRAAPGSRSSRPACCCAGSSATPSCPACRAVVLDEVHERQLDADLTLALLVDVRDQPAPRPAARRHVRDRRGRAHGRARRAARSVVTVPGSLHPVAEVWCPLPPGVRRSDDRGLTPRFLDHVAACVRRALAEQDGDVLVVPAGRRRGVRRSQPGWPGWTPTSARCTDGCRTGSRTWR